MFGYARDEEYEYLLQREEEDDYPWLDCPLLIDWDESYDPRTPEPYAPAYYTNLTTDQYLALLSFMYESKEEQAYRFRNFPKLKDKWDGILRQREELDCFEDYRQELEKQELKAIKNKTNKTKHKETQI